MGYTRLTSEVTALKFKKEMKVAQFLVVNDGVGPEQLFFGFVTPSNVRLHGDRFLAKQQRAVKLPPPATPGSVIVASAMYFGTFRQRDVLALALFRNG
jgi:hypothetical protein